MTAAGARSTPPGSDDGRTQRDAPGQPFDEGDAASVACLSVSPDDGIDALPDTLEANDKARGNEVHSHDLGRFVVGDEIGVGGTGRVSIVLDQRLLRDVAWKRGGSRLLREARILAQLEHPGIVPVHDMGFAPDGEPFFAMRVVKGRSLAEVLKDPASPERVALLRTLLQTAETVAFAHHRGIVHRDLKPANIMIGGFGESQVVDWGLARVLDDADAPIPEAVRQAVACRCDERVGTPGYMSPEQDAGRCADRRSDVFALGRILETLLRRVPTLGGRAGRAPLRAIARRSTAHAPADRYADAAAFASDLARFLDGERVAAHRYNAAELFVRGVRKHPFSIAFAAIAVVALAVLGAIHVAGLDAARHDAERAAAATAQALELSDGHLALALSGEARRLSARGARAEAEVLAAHALTLAEDPDTRGILSSFAGAPHLERTGDAPLPCRDPEVDPTRGLLLCTAADGVSLWADAETTPRLLWTHDGLIRAARLTTAGVMVATSDEIHLLDFNGHTLHESRAPNNPVNRASVSGSRVIIESGLKSILVDVATRTVSAFEPCGGALHAAIAPSPAGLPALPPAAVLCADGTLIRGDRAVRTPMAAPHREGRQMVSSGSDRVVVGTTKGEVALIDRDGRVETSSQLVAGMVRLLAPSPDGTMLLVAGERAPIRLVTLPDLAEIAAFPARVTSAVWDPRREGAIITTGRRLERWRIVAAAQNRPLRGAFTVPLRDGVVALDAKPDAPQRLAIGFGGEIGIITPTRFTATRLGMVTTKSVSLDGAALFIAGTDGAAILDVETLAVQSRVPSPLRCRRGAMLVDGTAIIGRYTTPRWLVDNVLLPLDDLGDALLDLSLSATRTSAAMLRESDRGILRLQPGNPTYEQVGTDLFARAVAISADGESVFTARRGEIAEQDLRGYLVHVYDADDAELLDVDVSLNGAWIAAGARDGRVFVWARGAPIPRARYTDHVERVPALTFSDDSRWLATGSWDRTVRIRDMDVLDAAPDALRAQVVGRYDLDINEALGAGRMD